MVDESTYVAWEAEVIKAFYTSERKVTALIPTDEKHAFVRKEKYILVVDACDEEGGCVSEKVGSGASEGLPEHQHVQLWHCGKDREEGVRFGLTDDGVFKHPACDPGGLTNLRQKLGEPVAFVRQPIAWGSKAGATAETVAEQVVTTWRELTSKELTPSLVQDIAKFLGTVDEGASSSPDLLALIHAHSSPDPTQPWDR